MNREDLYNSITDLPDAMVEQGETYRFRKSRRKAWLALAACLVLCLGLGSLALLDWSVVPFPTRDSEAPKGERPPAEGEDLHIPGGYPGPEAPGDAPESYAGPILPLTAWGGDLTAARTVTLDLSRELTAEVTDRYVLTNETETDQTVKLMYPFVGSFTSPAEIIPTLTLDGEVVSVDLLAGDFAGTFMNTNGEEAEKPEEMWNLGSYHYPNIFASMLQSHWDYLDNTLVELDMPEIPVILYQLELPEQAEKQVDFTCRIPEGVTVWPIGFRSTAGADAYCTYTFMRRHSDLAELVVLGGDVTEIETEIAYARTETTLQEYLPVLVGYPLGYQPEQETVADQIPEAQLFRATARWLAAYGPFGETPAIRYEMGLDILGDLRSVERIFFAAADVTIPAGGSVTVEAVLNKEASFNYGTPGETYELTTENVTGLTFTAQMLNLQNTEGLTIEGGPEQAGTALNFGRTTDIELNTADAGLWIRILRP